MGEKTKVQEEEVRGEERSRIKDRSPVHLEEGILGPGWDEGTAIHREMVRSGM